jgi:predicted acyl esterase
MRVFRSPVVSGVAILFFAVAPMVKAREPEDPELAAYIRAHYTKFEHRIPMRDGARLFTAVYLPNDTSTTYPILMTRTPYSCDPYGADRYRGSLGPIREFVEEGYIFVCQDVRGRALGLASRRRSGGHQRSGAVHTHATARMHRP